MHNALAIMFDSQDRTVEALEQAQRALDSYTAAGHANGRAVALNALGWFHAMLGNHQERSATPGSLSTCPARSAARMGWPQRWTASGTPTSISGGHAEAIQCYQQALDLHLEVSGNWGAAETLGHLGDARYAAGDLDGARADWEESLVILEDLNHPDAAQIRARLSGL